MYFVVYLVICHRFGLVAVAADAAAAGVAGADLFAAPSSVKPDLLDALWAYCLHSLLASLLALHCSKNYVFISLKVFLFVSF